MQHHYIGEMQMFKYIFRFSGFRISQDMGDILRCASVTLVLYPQSFFHFFL